MPVTNMKPDTEYAEDVTALQENFKLKNKTGVMISTYLCDIGSAFAQHERQHLNMQIQQFTHIH